MDNQTSDQGEAWDEAVDWLLRVQANPEDTALRVRAETWRRRAPAHAAAWARAEQVWRLTGAAGPAARAPRPALPWRLAAAAAVAALVLLPLARYLSTGDQVTGVNQTRTLHLADGGLIELAPSSVVSIDYSAHARRVALRRGEAFFTVGHDSAHRPFQVRADGLTMTDVGTVFDVETRPQGVVVAVANGCVNVARSRRSDETGAVLGRLGAGERLMIEAGRVEQDRVAPEAVASWRRGRLAVQDETVADVIHTVSRYHRGVILLTNPTLETRRVSGLYDLRDPQAALAALVAPFGGSVRAITPYVLIVSVNPL